MKRYLVIEIEPKKLEAELNKDKYVGYVVVSVSGAGGETGSGKVIVILKNTQVL